MNIVLATSCHEIDEQVWSLYNRLQQHAGIEPCDFKFAFLPCSTSGRAQNCRTPPTMNWAAEGWTWMVLYRLLCGKITRKGWQKTAKKKTCKDNESREVRNKSIESQYLRNFFLEYFLIYWNKSPIKNRQPSGVTAIIFISPNSLHGAETLLRRY